MNKGLVLNNSVNEYYLKDKNSLRRKKNNLTPKKNNYEINLNFQSNDESKIKCKLNSNKNIEYNFNECINVENYHKNEQLAYPENKFLLNLYQKPNYNIDSYIDSVKKRYLSQTQYSEITKSILKSIGDSSNNCNEKENLKENIYSKENIITINNYNYAKNIKFNNILSDLDDESDTFNKFTSDNTINKNNFKTINNHRNKREKNNYRRRKSSQSLNKIDSKKKFNKVKMI